MIVGILPGLGPVATIALLLPLTYQVEPASAVILLAGIFYGAMYGGTITSVLLRLPGEAASVVTTFDGHPMAKQGRAGPALGIAAIGSFIGGTAAVVALTFFSPWMASVALEFGPPEYALLALLGLSLVVRVGTGSTGAILLSACLGLLIATVGQDLFTSEPRYTFDAVGLLGGLDIAPIAMGLFGIAEVLDTVGKRYGDAVKTHVGRVLPSKNDLRRSAGAIVRGSGLGFLVGVMPGIGGTVASLGSYAVEKKWAKDPSRFGKGAIEGVAGPESANNAAASASFVPLLTLGIPGSAATAIMFGALLLHNVTPGPLLVEQHPEVFWGVIASMYIGNLILLVLNLPLVGIFIQILRVRTGIMTGLIVAVTIIGAYALHNDFFDVWVMLFFGVAGYVMKRVGLPPAPLLLAFVMGPILETAIRQSLLMSGGGLGIFVSRPVSLGLIIVTLIVVVLPVVMKTAGRQLARRQRSGTGRG
ncbi:tripartite tricarboxylate transporter permease [Jiangella asiatica]|uniref:Tripartite tricarboxylate transporter permease n=2 Tax=Jiangella asiatica TaxID=2530372 RepID=A0A4R5DLJ2_9ACTN|nr:tripartite tricarboxylate transporter permease [Jiangella asiatica]